METPAEASLITSPPHRLLTRAPHPHLDRTLTHTLTTPSLACARFPPQVAAVISEIVSDDANIIFGTSVDESFQDEISVTVVATSFGEEAYA